MRERHYRLDLSSKSAFMTSLILFILSLLPLFDLVQPGLPITHDSQDHVARIANFYQSLSEGNIIPRWAGNLNWGFGHPILMFLYPLPSYVASLFHFVGFSFIDSTKLIFAVSYVASIFAMYLWARDRWGKLSGFVAAMLYGFAPYRFVDLYVRGAIGEHVAFIFPPLILWSLDRKRWIVLALSVAGLILSHNAVSLMFAPIIVLYVLYRRRSFLPIILGLLLSTFFWVPALFEGKYTLRDIVTREDFSSRFINISDLFYSSGNGISKEFGVVGLLIVIAAAVLFFRRREKFLGGVLAVLVISIFLMLSVSQPIWQMVKILQKFQFPWRFLHLSVFCIAVLGGFVISKVKNQLQIAIIIAVGLLVTTYSMWSAKDYRVYPESFFTGIYRSTTDTGESSPIWSVRFMEHEPADPIEVIEGNAQVELGVRNTTRREYKVAASTRSRLLENTLYFPGWQVLVDGQQVPIEFQDPSHRGLMTFFVEPGLHHISVRFTRTRLRLFSELLTFFGVIIMGFFLIHRFNRQKMPTEISGL